MRRKGKRRRKKTTKVTIVTTLFLTHSCKLILF